MRNTYYSLLVKVRAWSYCNPKIAQVIGTLAIAAVLNIPVLVWYLVNP